MGDNGGSSLVARVYACRVVWCVVRGMMQVVVVELHHQKYVNTQQPPRFCGAKPVCYVVAGLNSWPPNGVPIPSNYQPINQKNLSHPSPLSSNSQNLTTMFSESLQTGARSHKQSAIECSTIIPVNVETPTVMCLCVHAGVRQAPPQNRACASVSSSLIVPRRPLLLRAFKKAADERTPAPPSSSSLSSASSSSSRRQPGIANTDRLAATSAQPIWHKPSFAFVVLLVLASLTYDVFYALLNSSAAAHSSSTTSNSPPRRTASRKPQQPRSSSKTSSSTSQPAHTTSAPPSTQPAVDVQAVRQQAAAAAGLRGTNQQQPQQASLYSPSHPLDSWDAAELGGFGGSESDEDAAEQRAKAMVIQLITHPKARRSC